MKALDLYCCAGGVSVGLQRAGFDVVGVDINPRSTPQRQLVQSTTRETYSVDDARAAMGIDWMPMRALSQAIPPAYSEWIGRQAIAYLETRQ